jgi:hypothetical protein
MLNKRKTLIEKTGFPFLAVPQKEAGHCPLLAMIIKPPI